MSELDHAHDTGNTPVIRRLLDDTVCEVRDDVFFLNFTIFCSKFVYNDRL